jgi:hypothetical protein
MIFVRMKKHLNLSKILYIKILLQKLKIKQAILTKIRSRLIDLGNKFKA